MSYCTDIQRIFKSLNLALPPFNAQGFEVNSPVDGRLLAKVTAHTAVSYTHLTLPTSDLV